jgi:hypothetical protein
MLRKNVLRFALIIPALVGVCVMAGAPDFSDKKKEAVSYTVDNGEIVVDKAEHNFGVVKKDAGNVSAVFSITNNTKTPIIINEVKASCGCTTPDWTKVPIEPGKTGSVTATYKPSGSGPFEKSVTISVSSGDKIEKIIVKIKGTVEL